MDGHLVICHGALFALTYCIGWEMVGKLNDCAHLLNDCAHLVKNTNVFPLHKTVRHGRTFATDQPMKELMDGQTLMDGWTDSSC